MSNFRQPNPIEKLRLEKYLTHIVTVSNYFLATLLDKDVYIRAGREEILIKFNKNHLLHLLGMKYSAGNNRYFQDLISAEGLALNKIYVNENTFDKLQAMYEFSSIFTGSSETRLFDGFKLFSVSLPKGLKTRKAIIAIGLDTESGEYYFPRSIVNLRKMKVDDGKIVTAIWSIDRVTGVKKFLKTGLDTGRI